MSFEPVEGQDYTEGKGGRKIYNKAYKEKLLKHAQTVSVSIAAKESGIDATQIYQWRKALEPTEKTEKDSDSSSNLKKELAEAKERLKLAYKLFTEEQTEQFFEELMNEETRKLRARLEREIIGS